jgi:hypothetical protein
MNRRTDGIGGAIFMIGIGLIFLLNLEFWPWILVVIAASSFLSSVSRRGLSALQGPAWLLGIALVIWQGWSIIPVIFILIGLSSLFKILSPRSQDEKVKRELPSDDDEYEEKAKRGVSLDDLIDYGRTSDGEIYMPDEDERKTRYS